MGFLRRLLFGKDSEKRALTPPSRLDKGDAAGETMIKVYDEYGREALIPRQQWLDDVLLGNLESARNDAEQLHQLIVSALNDGFAPDIVKHAERLHEIDPQPARSANILGIVYLECGRLADAERVLGGHLAKHGDNGYVLNNLAKVYERRGDSEKSAKTLWRALEVDPNQENALLWYHQEANERGGAAAGTEAFRRVAALAGSWLARLWLARGALDENRNEPALAIYGEALKLAPRPVPQNLLMQMTGDLGNHNLLIEALRLAMPLFDPAFHGVLVGNNLIKANVDLGRFDHARALVDRLYALKRPDFAATLAFWEVEIAKARVQADGGLAPDQIRISFAAIQGPVWLRDPSATAALLPPKADDAVIVCVVSPSVRASNATQPQQQLSSAAGRLARSLMLFLTEQIHLETDGVALAMQPFLVGGTGGFVLAGESWSDEVGASQARQLAPPADYVVLCHIEAMEEPFEVAVRLVRTIDESLLASRQFSLIPTQPAPAFLAIVDWLVAAAVAHAGVQSQEAPRFYRLPQGGNFNDYLLRIEQGLAVMAAAHEASPEFLNGEREILNGNLQLCLTDPENPTARLLLVGTLRDMKKARPQVFEEFREKAARLQREHPLAPPVGAVIEELLREQAD